MSLSISTNIASLRARRELSNASKGLSSTFERLSSGQRIVNPSDDPAGLAMLQILRKDIKVATVALRNANDGVSALNIADEALTVISHILMRISELAEMAANGTFSNLNRSAIEMEVQALGSEIQRISVETQFNKISLLSKSQRLGIQVGFDSASTSNIAVGGVNATLAGLDLACSGSSRFAHTVLGDTEDESRLRALTLLAATQQAIENVSGLRGILGADQSRLSSAINVLEQGRETTSAAESKIAGIDVAQETAQMIRQQILQQAGVAVLAQSNLQPKKIMALLS